MFLNFPNVKLRGWLGSGTGNSWDGCDSNPQPMCSPAGRGGMLMSLGVAAKAGTEKFISTTVTHLGLYPRTRKLVDIEVLVYCRLGREL